MSEPELQATARTETGKANVRRLRRTGYVPCTLYGVEKESLSLAINRKELEKMLSEAHSVIRVNIDGNEQRSVVKEIQYHPLKGEIIHLDTGNSYHFKPIPPFMQELIQSGGLMKHISQKIK